MILITVKPSTYTEDTNETKAYESVGIRRVVCPISWLKPMTAKKIADMVDKLGADVVEVSSPEDAILAISAKKIASNKNFMVTVKLPPNSPTPRSITKDILDGVNLWIFPSAKMLGEYSAVCGDRMKHTAVVEPACLDTIVTTADTEEKAPYPTLVFAGPLSDTTRLRLAIDAIDKHDDKTLTLRICGQGRASEVMPLVRHTRNLGCKDRIEWTGRPFDPKNDTKEAMYCIASARDITAEEAAMIVGGTDVIEPTEIDRLPSQPTIKNIARERYTAAFHMKQIRDLYDRVGR